MSDTATYVTTLVTTSTFIGVTWWTAHRDNDKRAEDAAAIEQRVSDERRFQIAREEARGQRDLLLEASRLYAGWVSNTHQAANVPVLIRILLAALPPSTATLLRYEFECYDFEDPAASKKLGDVVQGHGSQLTKPLPAPWIGQEIADDIRMLAVLGLETTKPTAE